MNKSTNSLPPVGLLRKFFFYCEKSKKLIRFAQYSRQGKYELLDEPRLVGTLHKNGYLVVKFQKQELKVHRIIWAIVYGQDPGEKQIDHINGKKSDNRIENLRLADASENQWNAAGRKSYAGKPVKVPYKGVYLVGNTIIAKIKFKNQTIYLGSFDSCEKAAEAYAKAAKNLHQEFANFQLPKVKA
jgi:hypothetical protein